MEKKIKIKIGFFYFSGIVLLIFGIFFVKKIDIFKNNYEIVSVFDSVYGLGVGEPVIIKGVKVGKLKEIKINENKGVLVIFEVKKEVKIPKDSQVEIISQSLIGGKTLEVLLGKSTDFLRENDTIAALETEDMMHLLKKYSSEIGGKITPTIDRIDLLILSTQEMVARVNRILADNEKNIQKSLSNIEKNTLPLVNMNLEQMQLFMRTLNSPKTQEIIVSLANIGQKVDYLLRQTQTPGNTFYSLFHERTLYDQMLTIITSTTNLLDDIKNNPERYVHLSLLGRESPEVKYKYKISEIEMKKKWQEYKKEQKK